MTIQIKVPSKSKTCDVCHLQEPKHIIGWMNVWCCDCEGCCALPGCFLDYRPPHTCGIK